MSCVTPAQLHTLVESAIQAPSADNKHPVRFQLGDQCIEIYHVRNDWSEHGYKRVLDLLSLGALVENLAIAASRFGAGIKTTLLPEPGQPNLVLRVNLLIDKIQTDPLWKIIPLRHTNRAVWFHGPRLSPDERLLLEAAVSNRSDGQLHWLDQPSERRPAIALMRRAETERFHNQQLHEELFSAIRFKVGWHTTCEEGLPPGALGVGPPLHGLFALLRHWSVMRQANRIGIHHVLGWRSCDLPCRLAPHLGLLTVKNLDTTSVFEVGRAFQRLWLTATSQGYAIQPMPASALYALEPAVDEAVPAKLSYILKTGWQARVGANRPLMLFRMGRAKPVRITAKRPSPESFIGGLISPEESVSPHL